MWKLRRIASSLCQLDLVKFRDTHHWLKMPAANFQIHNAATSIFLNPRIKAQDVKIIANDVSLSEWFIKNGRGRFHMEFTPLLAGWSDPYTTKVNVWFTDKQTAMMAKLMFGGR